MTFAMSYCNTASSHVQCRGGYVAQVIVISCSVGRSEFVTINCGENLENYDIFHVLPSPTACNNASCHVQCRVGFPSVPNVDN